MSRWWWQSGTLYQIYPRSFADSNDDGVGDLDGIAARLDHLVDLGVDALWLSPVYPSPMADFGYDVADYRDIDPVFGDLAAFDRLAAAAHARGLKLLMDFVPNHSSDRHPWFIASRSSSDDPKRDWYIWRDPAPDGGPPNNWISDFGGPAWDYDERTGEYYSHAFLPQQPDLNWRNPAVVAEMLDTIDWWFARGVDGFRIDVLWHIVKAADFGDNPVNPDYRPEMGEMHRVLQLNSTDQPEVHDLARAMRQVADRHGALLIGEIYLPTERLMTYYGQGDEVQLPFNFQLIDADWSATNLARIIADYEAALPPGAWPNWVLGNHDRPRVAARLGEAQARVAAMLLLTLRGTPTLYQGDELGIGSVAIPSDRVRDPRELREPGLGLGRDPVRTPMAWDGGPNAGFSAAEPWLPLHPDWATRNVAAESTDPGSMLNLHRRLLALRRREPALSLGSIELQSVSHDGAVLAYVRAYEGRELMVALNLTDEDIPDTIAPGWRTILSTLDTLPDGGHLRADEGLIMERCP